MLKRHQLALRSANRALLEQKELWGTAALKLLAGLLFLPLLLPVRALQARRLVRNRWSPKVPLERLTSRDRLSLD